ncbi:MAG: tRNA (adenosine(37)-N6)-dimethylallyltransferase MiaA [Candidatus Vogelbacteria bacterium]|nr:tRNA (adenosine(37)-N6)-dimethylallyltransferase MiaA [Candidatus Vogelbacteria bacterium]
METKPKIIVIVGPTTTGKSALAIKLAKALNSEIVSADSRQVYQGLNIGSGKVTKKEMSGIVHHLLDIASPKQRFTVSRFKQAGSKAITQILQSGKIPIVVGGTGFYLDTLVNGLVLPIVKPNLELRQFLSKKTVTDLYQQLKQLDPTRAKTIDQHNPQRLIRAIEIATTLGKVPKIKVNLNYDPLFIGLDYPDDILKQKINKRLRERLKQGLVAEVKKLHQQGLSWKRLEELGLEYRSVARYLQGKINKLELVTELESAIWHFAKRQRTWFKRNKDINWLIS